MLNRAHANVHAACTHVTQRTRSRVLMHARAVDVVRWLLRAAHKTHIRGQLSRAMTASCGGLVHARLWYHRDDGRRIRLCMDLPPVVTMQ
jgi:hypothetical protein